MENTQEKLFTIISERLGVDLEKIKLESDFKDDLDADSLDVVELVMELEDGFDIEIPDEDSARMKTVNDALTYLNEKLS